VTNYIYGLGGRDIFPEDIRKVFTDLQEVLKNKKVTSPINYLGSRD
jgi:pyruvate/2-oxoacid:ferredoxin oxidoreductase alpha subunit